MFFIYKRFRKWIDRVSCALSHSVVFIIQSIRTKRAWTHIYAIHRFVPAARAHRNTNRNLNANAAIASNVWIVRHNESKVRRQHFFSLVLSSSTKSISRYVYCVQSHSESQRCRFSICTFRSFVPSFICLLIHLFLILFFDFDCFSSLFVTSSVSENCVNRLHFKWCEKRQRFRKVCKCIFKWTKSDDVIVVNVMRLLFLVCANGISCIFVRLAFRIYVSVCARATIQSSFFWLCFELWLDSVLSAYSILLVFWLPSM